jgi:DNA polymerase-3 subunit delta
VSRGRGDGADALETLERTPLRPYYLLFGEETFLVDRALGVLRRRLLPEGRPGRWRTLWADEQADRLAEALEEIGHPSLFGGPGILVVRRVETLRDDAQAHVLAALPVLGAGGCLVLVAGAADPRRRLVAACQRAGAAFGFPPLADAASARAWIVRLAREEGHGIAPAAVQELLDRCGGELAVLAGEIRKLALHAGAGGRIEAAHVRAVVGSVRTHAVEELTARLGDRDLAGTARALRRLLADGEPPIRLLALLAANVRRALHVAELAEEGLRPEEIGGRLGMPGWLVARNLTRGQARDLQRILDVLGRLDLALKSTRPTDAVFDGALLEIAGVSRPAPG